MTGPKKRASAPIPSMWNADLCPTEAQTRYLDVATSDSKVELPLPIEMGEYTVSRVLGRGGMGVVLEGMHRRMQRRVAVKVLSSGHAQTEAAQEQFLAEIRAVARLLHPRIVTAFDAGQFESIVYLVMEFVDGKSLFELVKEEGKQSIPRSLEMIRQAAEGLAHAHLNSIIHRDVKPGNMMIDADGSLKILDLGLAAFARGAMEDEEDPKSRREICGTPEFMAPEQFEGGEVTESVDIYALGCTLHFLVAGETPYRGNPVALLRAHCTAPIPRLADLGIVAPGGVQLLINRMMGKRVEDRIAGMDEVIDAVTMLLDQPDGRDVSSGTGSTPVVTTTAPAARTEGSPITRPILAVDFGGRYVVAAARPVSRPAEMLPLGADGAERLPAYVAPSSSRGAILGDEAVRRLTSRESPLLDASDYIKSGERVDFGDGQLPSALPTTLILNYIRYRLEAVEEGAENAVDLSMTVPTSFSQMMRERIVTAAENCDLTHVRLLDRNIAAAASQFDFGNLETRPQLKHPQGCWLVVSVSDLSMEVSLMAVSSRRIQMLSVAGDSESAQERWCRRMRKWVRRRLAKMDSSDGSRMPENRADMKRRMHEAIDRLVTTDEVDCRLRVGTKRVKAFINTKMILACCGDLVQKLGELLGIILAEAGVDGEEIECCITNGALAQSIPVRNLMRNFGIQCPIEIVSQSDISMAAVQLAQMSRISPRWRPRLIPCNAHDLGLKMGSGADGDVTMVIPRLTSLPASIQRPLSFNTPQSQQLTLVEASETDDTMWLPFEEIEVEPPDNRECDSTFEIDEEGRMRCHVAAPRTRRRTLGDLSPSDLTNVQRILAKVGAS